MDTSAETNTMDASAETNTMDASAENLIVCQPFEQYMEQFDRDLRFPSDAPFEMPPLLDKLCHVYFLHNQHKAVSCQAVPDPIYYVDDVDEFLTSFNPIIKRDTHDMFQTLDPLTVSNMHQPIFRQCTVGLFFLEGSWNAHFATYAPFYNQNGAIVPEVCYFSFRGIPVTVEKGVLTAWVRYKAKNGDNIQDQVCFTMQVGDRYKDGVYHNSALRVPKAKLNYRKEHNYGLDTVVVNYKYEQNEYGFKVAAVYSRDSSDGGTFVKHVFLLDKPFQVTICYKKQELVKVMVNNLMEDQ